MTMLGLLRVGYACNNACTFCRASDLRAESFPAADIEGAIDEAAAIGLDGLVFAGGEANMRRGLLRWVTRARRLGLRVGLVTNGRMLSYAPFTDRLRQAGLEAVTLSLHGPRDVHDAVTRTESFHQTFDGLKEVARHRRQRSSVAVTVVVVVSRANLAHLEEVASLVASVSAGAPVSVVFSLVDPAGEARSRRDEVVPSPVEAADAVGRLLDQGAPHGAVYRHAGFPLCLLSDRPGVRDAWRDRRGEGLVVAWDGPTFGWHPLAAAERRYPEACDGCALRGRCPGVHRGYLEGDVALPLTPPPQAPRANSFNYEPVRDLGPWPAPCPLVDRPGPWSDRGRAVLLAHDGRLLLCWAGTRDFADDEIASIACDLGQRYLDVSGKPAPDDFARDLRQLRASPVCLECPSRDRCARCHEVVEVDVFSRDDLRVRELVADLRGRVLDVGCGGDARYGDLLEPLAQQGLIEYRGIDPDPAAVAALRARGWTNVSVSTLEELATGRAPGTRGAPEDGDDDDEPFDHLLLLRAFNHLHDPGAAMTAVARALRPGGQLLVVENVAFGLVRVTPAPRASGAPPRHEHYRNATSQEALSIIEPHGFELLEHEPVGPERSDQWLLRFRRRP